jgi:flagellar hook assembly protein FlgD
VETASSKVELETGAPASFAFEVEKPANKAVAVVTDANGAEVRKFDVDASVLGRREAVWDGHDNAGIPAAPGVYTIRVQLYDDAGKKVIGELPVLSRAKVVEARIGADGNSILVLSTGAETSLSDLRAIEG